MTNSSPFLTGRKRWAVRLCIAGAAVVWLGLAGAGTLSLPYALFDSHPSQDFFWALLLGIIVAWAIGPIMLIAGLLLGMRWQFGAHKTMLVFCIAPFLPAIYIVATL